MLGQRLVTAVILIPVVAWAVYAGGLWFFALVALVAGLAGYEFFAMMTAGGYRPSLSVGLGIIWVFIVDARHPEWGLGRFFVAVVIVLSLIWHVLQKKSATPALDWALTLAGGLTIGWLAAHFISLRELGPHWMALTLLSTWACDAGAYFVGLTLGRHKLIPRLSPKKTWEGAGGGWLCGVLVTVLVGLYLDLGVGHSLALGVAIATICPFGDLAVSMLKRQVGVKDSGRLIPGHGGMLDRIDTLLFSVVVVYYYVTLVVQ